jgi:nitroreductase
MAAETTFTSKQGAGPGYIPALPAARDHPYPDRAASREMATSAHARRFKVTTRRTVMVGAAALAVAGAGAAYANARDVGSLEDYEAAVAITRATLSRMPEIGDLIRYASLAASGHNAQPWTFRTDGKRIDILPVLTRRTPIVDPDDHHLFVSLGCAAENLTLACEARGRPGELRFDPSTDGAIGLELGQGAANPSPLFDAIPVRQSSRGEYDGRSVSVADLRALSIAAAVPGVDLILVSDRPQIGRIRDLVVAANSAQMADAAFVRELRDWMRFSPRQALRTGDGLFSATTGNPILPAWLGPMVFDLAFKARTENDRYARQIDSSAGVAVFVAQRADHAHWVLAGRAAQRFALQATALGLKCAFINQPVEVPALRPELGALVGLPGRRPDLVMRYGHGPRLPYSARRPVSAVMRA